MDLPFTEANCPLLPKSSATHEIFLLIYKLVAFNFFLEYPHIQASKNSPCRNGYEHTTCIVYNPRTDGPPVDKLATANAKLIRQSMPPKSPIIIKPRIAPMIRTAMPPSDKAMSP